MLMHIYIFLPCTTSPPKSLGSSLENLHFSSCSLALLHAGNCRFREKPSGDIDCASSAKFKKELLPFVSGEKGHSETLNFARLAARLCQCVCFRQQLKTAKDKVLQRSVSMPCDACIFSRKASTGPAAGRVGMRKRCALSKIAHCYLFGAVFSSVTDRMTCCSL